VCEGMACMNRFAILRDIVVVLVISIGVVRKLRHAFRGEGGSKNL